MSSSEGNSCFSAVESSISASPIRSWRLRRERLLLLPRRSWPRSLLVFAVLCRSGSACVTVGRGSGLYIGLKSGHLVSRELEAEFRASPQNVVCAPRPFVVHQVVDFPLAEIGTDQSAEGVVRAEYSSGERSVIAGEPPDCLLCNARRPYLQRSHEALKAIHRKIAPRQRGIGGPSG